MARDGAGLAMALQLLLAGGSVSKPTGTRCSGSPSGARGGWSLGVELLSNGARLLRLIWKGSGGGSLVGWRDREGSMDWIDGENEEGVGGRGIDGWDSSPRF